MQKKRNIPSRLKDALVILFCLSGAALSLYAFARELNAALVKYNEGPVATITFKYRSAQRRIAERVLWDRLRQESPIYNGDTIRTAELSEATLHFPDGNGVDLTENTMIQVIVNDDSSPEVALETGSVVVSGAEGSSSVALSSGGNRLTLASGGSAAMSATEGEGLSVRVISGSVETSSGVRVDSGSIALLSDSGALETSRATMLSPEPNARFLQHGQGDLAVPFVLREPRGNAAYTLALSRDRGFAETVSVAAIPASAGQVSVAAGEGTWFWRLLEGEEVRESGQFTVLSALNPAPIAPAEGYGYSYRSRKPSVRFLWTSNPYAGHWRLTVSGNSDMSSPVVDVRCPTPSSIVSSLSEGRWYWRVSPWYRLNDEGYVGATEVRSFTIRKSGELASPALIVPRQNEIVNTSSTSRSLVFSWRDNPDIDTTRITVSDSPSLASPVVDVVVRDNVVNLDKARADLRDGRWYWAVRQTDGEGISSPSSEIRGFVALSGDLVQRASFPPDGYAISTNLAADTRFTWKTNVPSDTRFQVSAKADFSDTIVDSVQNGGSASGAPLPVGEWHWRLVSHLGDLELATPGRRVSIVPPLDPPTAISPQSGGRAVVRQGVPSNFKWNPVEGATMYTFRLFPASGATPVYERTAIEGSELTLSLDSFAEGSWYWTVQAFAEETPLSTRRTGVIARFPFELKQLKPIALESPEDGLLLDGIEALLRPRAARWSSAELPASTRLVLSRRRVGLDATAVDSGEPYDSEAIVMTNPARETQLPRLEEGTWWWTVIGRTDDGLNITPTRPASIVVSPIPRLPACSIVSPEGGAILGPEFLFANRAIRFSWKPVSGATRYRFELRSPSGKDVHAVRETSETNVVLSDLKGLDEGKFRWSVEALNVVEGDIVLQRGELSKSDFTIDLPEVKSPRSRTKRTLYGN